MRKFYLLAIILYLIIIFYFSSIPVPRQLQNKPDIILHLVEYGGLGLLFSGYYTDNFKHGIEKRKLFFIIIFILIYAVSDEFHQSFTEGRVSSIKDIIVDFIGGMISPFIFYWRRKR